MHENPLVSKMATCHDPYRELELYLEQAHEEIGKAVQELEELEESNHSDNQSNSFSWNNSTDSLLLPPKAFRCRTSNHSAKDSPFITKNASSPTVNRVCHDGKIVDLKDSSLRPTSEHPYFSKTPFTSSLRPGTLGKNGTTTYSPNTRRRLWQMHPSISFPETTRDLLLLGKNAPCNTACNTSKCNGYVSDSRTDPLFNPSVKMRRRSNSDTNAPCISTLDDAEDSFVIPRPPSGDVNLLSIWANNLVLELDKSFSNELYSTPSFSPSSDYSLSPTKVEYSLETSNGTSSQFGSAVNKSQPVDACQIPLHNRSLKLVSMSPDSGIEQLSCETPDMIDDCDSSSHSKTKLHGTNCNGSFPDNLDHITPPPPEFGDESKFHQIFSTVTGSSYFLQNGNNFFAAVPVCEVDDSSEVLQSTPQDLTSLARVVAPKTVELEDCSVLRTTCTLNDASSSHKQSADKPLRLERRYENSVNSNGGYHTISVPKVEKASNGYDKWSCTLPRDSGKSSNAAPFYRSVSQSAVSTVNPVSIEELTAFMQRLKSQSPDPPSCADVSTDVKEDNENKDAVTQTTPVPLSRSSSFTWVTECDCSDWELTNLNNESSESIGENCLNCKAKKKKRKSSSSSSLGISSESDECEPATPVSGSSSSLYLSACSGSSDSFEENINCAEESPKSDELAETPENDLVLTNRRLRSSETTLRGSTLGDISEEQGTSETASIKSLNSNPSLADSNATDLLEQSASFPSTLKIPRKNKSTGSPAQPIEPTVLVINDLNLKSVSAPILLRQKRPKSAKNPESSSSDSSLPSAARKSHSQPNQVPPRSHSAKELNELQAIEACSWLRATGFPQYAQMYEDNQFPIDISIAQKDHEFLSPDSIQSLFRRLNTLNRCAKMKFVDHTPRKSLRMEDSDEEEQYALSENWEFQRSSRRWSRIIDASEGVSDFAAVDSNAANQAGGHALTATRKKYLSPEEVYCSSHDSVFIDEQHSSPDSVRRITYKPDKVNASPTSYVGDCSPGSSSGSGGTLSLASEDIHERRSLRRSGSDKVKEGAKALLRRMESLKGKRKKKGHSNKTDSIPYSGTDGSSSSSLTSSPQFHRSQKSSDVHDISLPISHKKSNKVLSKNDDDGGAHSDSECRMFLVSEKWKDANSNNTKHLKKYIGPETTVTITSADDSQITTNSKRVHKINLRQNRHLLHPSSEHYKLGNCDKRGSYYDNISAPIVVFNDYCTEGLEDNHGQSYNGKNKSNPSNTNKEDGEIIVINNERRDSGVGSSLTRGITCMQASWHCFSMNPSLENKSISGLSKISDLTAPQILLLRKLSLLKLTTVMEKFSPSSRTGWSWGVPKFIRRIRNPDYKDKVVFGVPLLLILQRTGQPLPISIQAAIHYLRNTALDSTGLFRKSGVRSRIQKLKCLNESNPENISYDEQQAYDVADMLKQYFRELPEALLTNKLSETFISIFQYVPEDLRIEAMQAALMLMPDENREVLQSLLEFLSEVCQHSGVNQMTATNIAVCFAPSLFHLSSPRSASSSPRRRKTVGVPDLRELNENRAACECLASMVTNYKVLFSVSEEMISQSRISSASHLQPAALEEISSCVYNGQSGIKGYIDSCIQMFLKEAKEKYKGFVNICQYENVELSYKKLSDGHPLRLWKVSTEVEAPPFELLNRVLREKHLWDASYIKSKVLARLNNNTEVFQYLSSSLPPHPPCDYCILRSWRTDLPKSACILVETSINYPEAEVISGAVKALALASRYLIEPCGSGKSRITHLSRIDTRGRSPEWYNRAYGHICTLQLIKLRNSFSRSRTDGPETKV